jgi:hypothetical protein
MSVARTVRRVLAAASVAVVLTTTSCGPPAGRWWNESLPQPDPGGGVPDLAAVNATACLTDGACRVAGAVITTDGRLHPFFTWKGVNGWEPMAVPPSPVLHLSCGEHRTCAASTRNGVAAWDGTAWHEVNASQLWGNGDSSSASPVSPNVSCGGPRSCVAVYRGHVGVWDGTRWTGATDVVPTASAVSCGSATFCLATASVHGSGEVYRWDGSTWSALPPILGRDGSDETANVFDVECWGANQCYILAVGQEEQPQQPGQLRLLRTRFIRWDGTAYTETVAPSRILDLSCGTATNCVALRGALPSMWLNRNGWQELPPPPTTPDRLNPSLMSVACDFAGCLAGGSAMDAEGRMVAAAYRMDFGNPRY